MKIDPAASASIPKGRIDMHHLDANTEEDVIKQQRADDEEAMKDAAKFTRRVRKRLGLTQTEFSHSIDVPFDTVRNWEQGKRSPAGAARALLKILDKAQEAALQALR